MTSYGGLHEGKETLAEGEFDFRQKDVAIANEHYAFASVEITN